MNGFFLLLLFIMNSTFLDLAARVLDNDKHYHDLNFYAFRCTELRYAETAAVYCYKKLLHL